MERGEQGSGNTHEPYVRNQFLPCAVGTQSQGDPGETVECAPKLSYQRRRSRGPHLPTPVSYRQKDAPGVPEPSMGAACWWAKPTPTAKPNPGWEGAEMQEVVGYQLLWAGPGDGGCGED